MLEDLAEDFHFGCVGRPSDQNRYDLALILDLEALFPVFHMHAKCVVVDARRVLVTSANFSYTAQEKNVEVGVGLDDPRLAARLRAQFDTLVKRGDMVRHGL